MSSNLRQQCNRYLDGRDTNRAINQCTHQRIAASVGDMCLYIYILLTHRGLATRVAIEVFSVCSPTPSWTGVTRRLTYVPANSAMLTARPPAPRPSDVKISTHKGKHRHKQGRCVRSVRRRTAQYDTAHCRTLQICTEALVLFRTIISALACVVGNVDYT